MALGTSSLLSQSLTMICQVPMLGMHEGGWIPHLYPGSVKLLPKWSPSLLLYLCQLYSPCCCRVIRNTNITTTLPSQDSRSSPLSTGSVTRSFVGPQGLSWAIRPLPTSQLHFCLRLPHVIICQPHETICSFLNTHVSHVDASAYTFVSTSSL